MLHIEIPKDKEKIEKQILALEYESTEDINDTDREIYQWTLHELRKALGEFKE